MFWFSQMLFVVYAGFRMCTANNSTEETKGCPPDYPRPVEKRTDWYAEIMKEDYQRYMCSMECAWSACSHSYVEERDPSCCLTEIQRDVIDKEDVSSPRDQTAGSNDDTAGSNGGDGGMETSIVFGFLFLSMGIMGCLCMCSRALRKLHSPSSSPPVVDDATENSSPTYQPVNSSPHPTSPPPRPTSPTPHPTSPHPHPTSPPPHPTSPPDDDPPPSYESVFGERKE